MDDAAAGPGTGEPRWLDAEERQAFLGLMSVALRLEPALDSHLRRTVGIRHFEYSVLAYLSEAPGRQLSMTELARAADGSLSRLSQVVSRLESRGWVRREPDPADGRTTLALLTEQGWDQVLATAPHHVGEVRRLVFDGLTRRQVTQLTTVARAIMRAVDPDDRCLQD